MRILSNGAVAIADACAGRGRAVAVARDAIQEHHDSLVPESEA
jgi:hypothetical protein